MPYAYYEKINHVYTDTHLEIYVTFRHQMQRSAIPQASPPVYDWYPIPDRWLIEADEVPVAAVASEWLDEFTLKLTSDTVASEPTGVTLAYAGPDEKLCYNWGKQIEPWGPRQSFAGYPTTPAPHNSTHENGGADEINVAGLSGLAADTQHSFVNRGDPAAADWTINDFEIDGLYHELDLSGIIPPNTNAVLFRAYLRSTAAANQIRLRKNGSLYTFNSSVFYVPVANRNYEPDLIVSPDSNSKIQYMVTSTGWNILSLTVAGWWL
jgi:hypothetical protein